jgi:hypothetical protein
MQPHSWLMPLHRRVATPQVCVVWVAIEVWLDLGGLWFWLALGATVYALWDFFLSGTYPKTTDQAPS